jgi:hypothetical protein
MAAANAKLAKQVPLHGGFRGGLTENLVREVLLLIVIILLILISSAGGGIKITIRIKSKIKDQTTIGFGH